MTKIEMLDKLLAKGKISQERYDVGVAKINAQEEAKEKYKGKKSTLTKADLTEIIEKLIL